MNAEKDSIAHAEELAHLNCTSGLASVTKNADCELKNAYTYTATPTHENIEISFWKNKRMRINKTLIPLRTAQFLWFASGNLCSSFFSLMLIHRGLTLKEFSVVFSMIFLFQLIVAYISGIVADMLGNGKPVLLFQMLITILVLIGLLLSPNINEKSCIEQDSIDTCLLILNITSDLEYCKYICSRNKTDYNLNENRNNYTNELVTFSEEMDSLDNNTGVLEDVFISNETIISCNKTCFCFDQSTKNCFYAPKVGLRLLYAALIWSFYSFYSTGYRFLDFASLNVAKKYNSDFGNERVYGVLGALTAIILCNFLLNIDKSKTKGYYDNVLWFSAVMFIMASISTYNINEVISPPGVKLTKKTLRLFTDIKIVSLIFVAFVSGSAYTFNRFFHIYFLDRLKASKTVIGLYLLTGPLYGLPIYLTNKWWLRKLDMKLIVIISLLSYTISATCYSFLYNPWLSLIIEFTKPFYFQLFWIATVTYSNKIAPEGFAATVNAIVGTVHFGIGRSFSVSVGGYLMSRFGARTTFRILAGFCFVTAILYATFNCLIHLFCKNRYQKASKDPEERKSMREDVDT